MTGHGLKTPGDARWCWTANHLMDSYCVNLQQHLTDQEIANFMSF